MTLHGVNWGFVGGWAGALLALGTSFGYLAMKDYRKALYFFFAFCINLTIVWR